VDRVRQECGIKKVGHTGTLDPLATGVLVLCIGQATRLSSYISGRSKSYWTRIRLGITTDTLDADGKVTASTDEVPQDPEAVHQVVNRFLGDIEQIPPMYSARKVSGKKLYELAREGKQIARESRPVTIHDLKVVDFDPPDLDLQVICSSGTYIRVLADDIGKALGCGAHVSALRRTAVDDIGLNRCKTLEELEALSEADAVETALIDPNEALASIPGFSLDCEASWRFGNGNAIACDRAEDLDKLYRVLKADGRFLGIGQWVAAEGVLKPVKVFAHSES